MLTVHTVGLLCSPSGLLPIDPAGVRVEWDGPAEGWAEREFAAHPSGYKLADPSRHRGRVGPLGPGGKLIALENDQGALCLLVAYEG